MHHAACECPDCDWGPDDCNDACTCSDIEDGTTTEPCKRCGPDTEYLRAVLAFHEPNTPPSTCMWCGLPSPCPFPKPEDFDGLTTRWGFSTYVNPPFGSIIHEGKKKGPTAWARKAIQENQKGKRVVMVYPIDKWVLMLLAAGAKVRNLGDVKWCAVEDGEVGRERVGDVLAPLVSAQEGHAKLQQVRGDVHAPILSAGRTFLERLCGQGWSLARL